MSMRFQYSRLEIVVAPGDRTEREILLVC